jgi:beta-lactamase class A
VPANIIERPNIKDMISRMQRTLRLATLLVATTLLLTACAGTAAQANEPAPTQPAPTAAPTAPPTAAPTAAPTAVPTLAEDVLVAGVDVGGLDEAAARAKLEQALQPLLRPLELAAGDTTTTLHPGDIGLELPLDDLLAAARDAAAGGRVDLQVRYDAGKLRAAVEGLANEAGGAGTPEIDVITSSDPISRSFTLAGGATTLDVDAAVAQIDERLHAVGGARKVTLPLVPAGSARPTPEQLQEQIAAMAKQFKGTVGVYVYDLAGAQQIAGLNERTAFTAASTIKVAIMLNAYAHLPKLTTKQTAALQKMIVESDNLKANDVLAAAAGGTATESAFEGAEQMSAMLADLGLKNTFLYVPFESADFIKLYKVKFKTGPKQGGEAPFISSSNTLRTTPFEIAQIYVYLEQCSRGEGVLLETFAENLTAERCTEMIDWLKKNGDQKRMMSGLPKGADVAHKSGWIPPIVQGDAGIVRSPGGDFIVSIYVYQTGERYSDKQVQQLIGSFARLVYSYYNPVVSSR